MAGQTTITKYMDAIAAACTAYGGGGIVTPEPGYHRYADAENFEATIRALNPVTPTPPPVSAIQGYFSFWLERLRYTELELSPTTIIGEMAVYVPTQVSSDMNAAWDFVLAFIQVIGGAAAYSSIPLPPPNSIECKLHKVDMVSAGGVCIFDFGNYGGGGIVIDP